METRQDAGSIPAASTLMHIFSSMKSLKQEVLHSKSYIIIEPNSGRMCNNIFSACFQSLLGIRFNKSLSFAKYSKAEMGSHDSGCNCLEGNDFLCRPDAWCDSNLNGTFPYFFDFSNLDIVDSPEEYPEQTDSTPHALIKALNLADILAIDPADSHGLDFRIHGHEFFQEPTVAKYIRANLDKIFHKELLEDSEEGIFIHYRLGDISQCDRAVRVEHFEKAIVSIPNHESLPKYISSDSPNDPRIKKICDNYGFVINEATAQETIKFGSRFTNKLLSYGTFSWFIGVLGSQNNIIFPNNNDYDKWCGDIFVFDDWHEFDSTT